MTETGLPGPPYGQRLAALRALAGMVGGSLDDPMVRLLEALPEPDAPTLVRCARDAGLDAKALRMRWGDVCGLSRSGAHALLLMKDGGAALLAGMGRTPDTVLLRDPLAPAAEPREVDRFTLESFSLNTGIIVRRGKAGGDDGAPLNFGWFMRQVLEDAAIYRTIAVTTVVVALLSILPPLVFMVIADRVIVYQSWATYTALAMLLLLMVVFETALGWAQRHLSAVAARRMDGRVNMLMMQRVLRLPLDYFEKNPVGEVIGKVFALYRIRDFVTGPLFRTFLDFVTLIAVLPVLFIMNSTLAGFVVACGVVIAVVVFLSQRAVSRATTRSIEADRRKGVTLIETIQGMRTVKALAIEAQQSETWNRNVAESLQAQYQLAEVNNKVQTVLTPVDRQFQIGVLLLATFILLNEPNSGSIGSLFAFIMLASRAAAPLMSISQLQGSFALIKTALAEAGSVMNQPGERPSNVAGMRPRFTGRLTFEDVTFSYPGALSPALQEVSFEVPAGSLVGLVGRSGSGKSTITRLLQSLSTGYTGLVKFDGIELREIDLHHLRKNLGVVLQDNFLFRGTIRHNIEAGRAGISFEDVVQACRMAGAEEFIERLPRGFDTFIEEGSPNLSGGQKQRLAIARAIVTNPAILILDEATSALDPESEAIVNANLRRLARGRTVVVVSHRLSTIADCDVIMLMERGRLSDAGRQEDLLRRSQIYRQLWNQQHRPAGASQEAPHAIIAAQ